MEMQENKSQELLLSYKEQHELDEQQLESVQGAGLKKVPAFIDLTVLIQKRKRTASEAGLPNYNILPNKAPRVN
jgi:hypothetical protein